MDDLSIRISGLGIKYSIPMENAAPQGLIKSLLHHTKKTEFWALKGIDLDVRKGEIFGIIGSNGAGKSTLLKALSGIIPVTEGSLSVNGRIAPLIELGAAFNPELTGAENIVLSGSIYRIPRRIIKDHFENIVEFSGLRKFIHTPVKNYSSGMFMRLAFSIIIFFVPDIVFIDEVFAVGDAAFQKKSFDKILDFRDSGATIVLVTHDLDLVGRICDRTLVLSKGRMSFIGPNHEALAHYRQIIQGREDLNGSRENSLSSELMKDTR